MAGPLCEQWPRKFRKGSLVSFWPLSNAMVATAILTMMERELLYYQIAQISCCAFTAHSKCIQDVFWQKEGNTCKKKKVHWYNNSPPCVWARWRRGYFSFFQLLGSTKTPIGVSLILLIEVEENGSASDLPHLLQVRVIVNIFLQ